MNVKSFALVFGIVYILIGLAGFIPGLLMPMEGGGDLTVETLAGDLLGIFPVNILHTIVHLAVGIWAVIASRDFDAARTFAKINAVLFGILTIMGLIPGLDTTFGLIPLHGADVILHAITTLLLAYFGFAARGRGVDTATGA